MIIPVITSPDHIKDMKKDYKLTKDHVINYLIDVAGYSEEDFEGLNSLNDLLYQMSNAQISDCLEYNGL